MDSYPQLIPKITKVVETLKTYKRRHSHGGKEENINTKYCHSDRGSFEQRVGQGGLGEVATTTSTDCKCLVMFSLIYTWPISFNFVYDFIFLSFVD
jgi:hypothetical protein